MRIASVVLLSGGLDSAANLAFCAEQDRPLLCLTADYGQRAAQREITAASALAAYYGVEHEVVRISWLGELGGSSLTARSEKVPELRRDQLDELSTISQTAKSVWVPNRNGILINVAAAFAERLDAARVVVGFNAEEAVTFPDNSEDFMVAATQALRYSTANGVKVFSYTARWNKKRIVAELRALRKLFPFESLWSCYHGDDKPCGKCESCSRLARALE